MGNGIGNVGNGETRGGRGFGNLWRERSKTFYVGK